MPETVYLDRARQLIDAASALLDGDRVARLIDEPMEAALAEFSRQIPTEWSHRAFHEMIARFVQHAYEKALRPPRRLSLSQAHDEAVALLAQSYRGGQSDGYDAAVADAADAAHDGLGWVVACMAEALRAREAHQYKQWVAFRYLLPADWRTRCAMAGLLHERLRPGLPAQLQRCPPEQLAEEVATLFMLLLEAEGKLDQGDLVSAIEAGSLGGGTSM